MNTVTTLALFLIIMIALGIMASRTSMAFARQQQKFIAKFTGYDEVPPKILKQQAALKWNLGQMELSQSMYLMFQISVMLYWRIFMRAKKYKWTHYCDLIQICKS